MRDQTLVGRIVHRAAATIGIGLTFAFFLSGCIDDQATTLNQRASTDESTSSSRPPDLPDDRPARSKLPAGAACGWTIASDINVTNVAFPDESAKYWVALVPHVPGTRVRLDGRFGHMRYFSFNVYDPLLRPVDAIADVELVLQPDAINPFVDETAPLGGSYTAYVEFAEKPENPAPNTIYSGQIPSGNGAYPNPLGTGIFYRSYDPDEGYAFDGGVGLPFITLETSDGSEELAAFADCDEPLVPSAGGIAPDPGLNEALMTFDLPDELLGLVNFPTAEMPPRSRVFYGLPSVLLQIVGNVLGIPLGDEPSGLPASGGGGFLSNVHNHYISIAFSRTFGSTYIVRGRAPSWRGAPGVEWSDEQLRYWSICQNEFASQRYVACTRDDQAALDEEGFYTVLVSDPADRPEWATAENGITWLPWGPFPDGLIIYRHMLPHPSFMETIRNVPQGTEPAEVLRDYAPIGAYCYQPQLVGADSPKALFNACLQATLEQGEQHGLLPAGDGH